MTKFMRTLMVTGICASVMVTGFAFADSTEVNDMGGRPAKERMSQEDREAKKAEKRMNEALGRKK